MSKVLWGGGTGHYCWHWTLYMRAWVLWCGPNYWVVCTQREKNVSVSNVEWTGIFRECLLWNFLSWIQGTAGRGLRKQTSSVRHCAAPALCWLLDQCRGLMEGLWECKIPDTHQINGRACTDIFFLNCQRGRWNNLVSDYTFFGYCHHLFLMSTHYLSRELGAVLVPVLIYFPAKLKLCHFGGEIRTQIFNIYNINKEMIQTQEICILFPRKWINKLVGEEHKVPEH